ncbi:hypothetical protein BD289DRAFT_429176 [Coniella lustricola]|uniref:Uncharacterized protein n=1 Tax=Coniella lustricola TaxID=2025994 RepID=A0A2T3ADG2_9PEZI|nr:hypothetical protein BD289DRAFT_429176 [Coniella lustricola]
MLTVSSSLSAAAAAAAPSALPQSSVHMPSSSNHCSSHSGSSKHKARSSSSSAASSSTRQKNSPSSCEPASELRFFMYSDPAQAKSADNKKLVRSHVARASHAKSRREREAGGESSSGSYAVAGLPTTMAYEDSQPDGYAYYDDGVAMFDASTTSYDSSVQYAQHGPAYPSSPYSVPQAATASTHMSQWDDHLLYHYINVLVPSRHSPCDHPAHPIDVAAYRRGMTGPWIAFCQTDQGLLQGIFQAACHSLAKWHRRSGTVKDAEMYEQRALHYRGECLRYMRETMPAAGQRVTDNAIGIALLLSFNEYIAGDLREAQQHIAACEYMVDMAGGYQYLGVGGFLAQLIQWFKQELAMATGQSSKSSGKKRS